MKLINARISLGAFRRVAIVSLLVPFLAPVAEAKTAQTITFNPLGLRKMRAGTNEIVLTAEASASSGLPLSFASSRPAVAKVAGGKLIIKWPATANNLTVTARQPGNASYLAAVPVASQLTLAAWPIYVDEKATSGANDGSSWANAFTDMQSALNLAKSGDEIWVAKGTYKPSLINPLDVQWGDGSDPRAKTFFLKNGVHLYGGFSGGEASKDDRDVESNPTILSGDFGENDVWPVTENGKSAFYENAYHVVCAYKLATKTILDGFVITGGYAGPDPGHLPADYDPGNDPHALGGGLACLGSNLWIEDCTFTRNAALMGGGGAFAYAGNATIPPLSAAKRRLDIRRTVFRENIVPDYRLNGGMRFGLGGGGVLIAGNYAARLSEVELLQNSAPNGGGMTMERGISSIAPSVAAYRCLLYANRALCSPDDPEDPDDYVTDGLGGAVRVTDLSCLVADSCAFISNEASSNGFSAPQVDANEGVRYGGNGGVASVDRGGKLRVSDSGFLSNSADWAGGAITVNTWSRGPVSSLEIYYCTIYANQAKWGCGLNNFASSMRGYGNIVYKNWSTNGSGYYNDLGNTVQVSSKSFIKESIFTYPWTLNDNTGSNHYFDGQTPLPDIFANASNPAGVDGEWGTSDDGFVLLPSSLPLGKVSTRPPDFVDQDEDGKTSELVPLDAKGAPFETSGPYDCGPYQQ